MYRLMQLQQHVDVFLSHDWPSRIADHGNKAQLCRCKKFLANEVYDKTTAFDGLPHPVLTWMSALESRLDELVLESPQTLD